MGNKISNSTPYNEIRTTNDSKKTRVRIAEYRMKKIIDMIHTDKNKRNTNKNLDLYSFKDILYDIKYNKDISVYNGEYSTFYNMIKTYKLELTSQIEFNDKFFNTFNFMKNINYNNILIAGGVLSSILGNIYYNDIDIFIYGFKTIKDATMKIIEVSRQLKTYCEKNEIPFHIISTDHLYRIYVNKTEIQFIPRLYKSIAQILYGFDLGSSSIGFDGNKLYFSDMGKYSFVNSCNIIDINKYNLTYITRLLKYFHRGFNIIAPFIKKKKYYYVDTYDIYGFHNNSKFPMVIDKHTITPCKDSSNYYNSKHIQYSKYVCSPWLTKSKLLFTSRRVSFYDKDDEYTKLYTSNIVKYYLWNKNKKYIYYNKNLKYIVTKYIIQTLKNKIHRNRYNYKSSKYYSEKYHDKLKDIINISSYKYLMTLLGRHLVDIIMSNDLTDIEISLNISKRADVLCREIEDHQQTCENLTKNIKWIVDDPGQQINSSIYPSKITYGRFYHKFLYIYGVKIKFDDELIKFEKINN